MCFSNSIISFILIFAIGPALASTQNVGQKEKAKRELDQKKELERKTLLLLDEIIASAPSLRLVENRSFILASAAEVLWEYDEKRARDLFWEAMNNLAIATNDAGGGKGQKPDAFYATLGLRQEILKKLARRDAPFALDLLPLTRQPAPLRANQNYHLPNHELLLEQQLAGEVAAGDPKQALQIARDSLAKGFSLELLNLLDRLNDKNSELATRFAGEITEKLKREDLAADEEAPLVAVYLLLLGRDSNDVVLSVQNASAAKVKPFVLEEKDRRDLVRLITDAALGVSPKRSLLSRLQEIMPEVERFAPERLPQLRQKLTALKRTMTAQEKSSDEYNSLFRSATPEEMLKAAGRAPDDTREMIYREAILKAVFQGDSEQLRTYINDQVQDTSRRKELLDTLDGQLISGAIYRGKVEELRKLLPTIRAKEERVRAMAHLAIFMSDKGEREAALELLDEARLLIKLQFKTETQTNALLALALAYALVQPTRSFEIIESIVDRANEDLSRTLLLEKFLKHSGLLRKGEIVLRHSSSLPLDFILDRYGKGLSALATADFARLKAIADRFQRNELRIMARLLIAQSIIRGVSNEKDVESKNRESITHQEP